VFNIIQLVKSGTRKDTWIVGIQHPKPKPLLHT
jgi:hypothetical protein